MTRLDAARASQQARTEQGTIKNHNNIRKGWTAVYDRVGHCPQLSDGAFRTYFNLCTYDYGSGSVFPGEAKLAEIQGVTPRTVRSNIKELEAAGLIIITQRGLGLTNLYDLPDAENWTADALIEWKKSSTQRSGKILPIKDGKELPIQAERNCRSSRKPASAKEEEVTKQKKKQANKGKSVGADAPTRSASRLRMISTEDDKALAYVRRVALKLSRDVFKNKNSAPETIDRYESWFTDLMAQDEEATPRALVEFLNAARDDPYFKGKAHIFTRPEQIVKLWSDWQATGTIRVETKPRTPAHIQREHDYARNGEVDYSHEEQTPCCGIPVRFGHAYDCPHRAEGVSA